MNFCFYSKYNGKSTIEQLRRVTFLFPPRHFILSIHNGKNDGTSVQTNSKYDRGKGEILL